MFIVLWLWISQRKINKTKPVSIILGDETSCFAFRFPIQNYSFLAPLIRHLTTFSLLIQLSFQSSDVNIGQDTTACFTPECSRTSAARARTRIGIERPVQILHMKNKAVIKQPYIHHQSRALSLDRKNDNHSKRTHPRRTARPAQRCRTSQTPPTCTGVCRI